MQTAADLMLALGVSVAAEILGYYIISGGPFPIGLRLRLVLLDVPRMGAICGSKAADSAPKWLEDK